jgi:hypothetical protein
MNRRKMTLNEEINQMKKLFGHMNMPLLIRESVGNPVKGGALAALDSGSSIARYVGVGVAKEIEDAIVLAARNSDAITKSLGKQINSFDDLVSAYPGMSRSEVAMSAISAMGKQNADNLINNISSQLGSVNMNNLKLNMTKLTAPEVQSLKTSLTDLESGSLKQLSDPATAEAAAEILPVTINKIKGVIDGISDSSMPAATKQSLLDTLDGIEAQASTVMIKTGANEVTDNLPSVSTIKEVLNNDNDWAKIKTIAIEYGINVTDSMKNTISDFIDSIGNAGLKRLGDDAELAFAPGKVPLEDNVWYNYYKYDSQSQSPMFRRGGNGYDNVTNKAGKHFDWWNNRAVKTTRNVGLVILLITGFTYLLSGNLTKDVKEGIKDIYDYVTTPDAPNVDCVQKVVGYNDLTDDQKTYVGNNVGCTYSDENADPKCTGFANVSGKLQIAFGNCVEEHVVDKGGLRGSRTSGDCRGGGNTTIKKYACVNNNCVEDPNGTFTDPTCGGTCGGNNTTPTYTNDEAGFNKWVVDNGYTNPQWSGKWYMDNGTDKQATYSNGTWQ